MNTAHRAAGAATAQLTVSARHGDAAGAGRGAAELAGTLRDFTAGMRAATAAAHPDCRDR